MRTTCLILVLIMILALASACPKSQSGLFNMKRTGQVVYPQGWPLPSLTVPTGAQCARSVNPIDVESPDKECITYMDFGDGLEIFGVGFHTTDTYKDVIRHFDSQLSPLDFRIKEDDQGRLRRYIAPDSRFEVLAMYRDSNDVWYLEVESNNETRSDSDRQTAEEEYTRAQPIP